MAFNFLKKILQTGSKRRAGKGSRGPTPFRPRLERLEDRVVLATRFWDGGGDLNWMNRLNWQQDIAPVAGDDLVFDFESSFTRVNDFPNDTTFDSITILRSATLGGNRIILGPGGLVVGSSSPDAPDFTALFGPPLRLTSSSGAVDVRQRPGGNTSLILADAATGSRLTKTGVGTLSLLDGATNLGGTVV